MKSALRDWRLQAELSERQCARQIGVSQPTLRRWESGETPIPSRWLEPLATMTGLSVYDLLGLDAPKPTRKSA